MQCDVQPLSYGAGHEFTDIYDESELAAVKLFYDCMVNFIIYIRKFMACAIAHRLKVALRHRSAAERRIASAASVLSNDMFVDMPAHAVADSRAGKESSQRPG